jgi:hypothetical protein
MHLLELVLRRRDIRPHGHRVQRARASGRVVVVGHGVLALLVDAGEQVELGALDGVRFELLSTSRVDQAVREEDGAVAVEVRVVVSSITWTCSKLVLEALADLPEARSEELVDSSSELV